jgi:hypothetical protein
MLPWHEAEPRRELPPVVEAVRIGDGGDKSGGAQWPDAWNLLQPDAELAAAVPGFDLVLEFVD